MTPAPDTGELDSQPGRPTERPAARARWPWVGLGAFFVVAVVGLRFVAANHESIGGQIPFVIAFGMFGVVGALILSRLPGNRIGALLLEGSSVIALSFLTGEIMTYLVRGGRASGALLTVLGLISNVGWVVGILPVLLFLPLLFPDGHLPSRRWAPLAWVSSTAVGFLALASVFGSKELIGSVDTIAIRNPLYIGTLGRFAVSDAVINLLLIGCLIASLTSLVARFRRSHDVQRQQIKWVAASIVLVIAAFILALIVDAKGGQNFLVDTLLNATAFLSIPVSIAIAVLQYRLYDLDVVVKRAVVAATLALVVIGVYVGVVSVFGALAAERRSSGTIFVIALLLGVAFRPVARVARRIADRLVYGRRATPYEVLTEFSERVGEAYASDDVLARMAQILGQGVGATTSRVWLRVGRQLRVASSWPAEAPATGSVTLLDDAVSAVPGENVVEVRDRGEILGALSVSMPANDPMTPAKDKLVRDLASQAGLVLRNVRLVEELKASQRRIVAAQDEERRRLERNIHDGAQQQLVALVVKARLARSVVERDAAKAAEVLDQIGAETQDALENLRDLARGIYPPLLADQGLPTALRAQARKAPMPVEVSPDGVGRYPAEVEAAVYFSVLEALQNVGKYARASTVSVHLGEAGGRLTFEVRDDGVGFDPASTARGTGLQGIADRLAALGGVLEVASAPGAGTTVAGAVPVNG